MAIDFLKGAAQGIANRTLRKVAGNLPGLLGLNKGKGGNSSDTSSLESTKFTTKAYSFPGDVAAAPGTGNQGHYIMFFINQQTEVKYLVQVNGKVRGNMILEAGLDQAAVEAKSMENENVARHLENKNIIKVIFIKDKLINFVHS